MFPWRQYVINSGVEKTEIVKTLEITLVHRTVSNPFPSIYVTKFYESSRKYEWQATDIK